MIEAGVIAAGEAATGEWTAATSAPGEARQLAVRLHREFGVPVGVLDRETGLWISWSGGAAGSPTPIPPKLEGADRVATVPREGGGTWLVLHMWRPTGRLPWSALAVFPAADPAVPRPPAWADRALVAWGEALWDRLREEADSAGSHGSGAVAEGLIRRLRVSDSPGRFQKRATAVLRDAIDVEAVAWVPGDPSEAVVVAGHVEGIDPRDYRELISGTRGESLRICNSPGPSHFPAVRRFLMADAGPAGDDGWLVAVNTRDGRPFSAEAEVVTTVASLVGTQKANARSYSDLKDLLFGVIRALTAAIDAKDPYTSGHSERVARIAVRVGQELGMSRHDQGDLYLMGLLHDVGKIGVEDGVLKKPGKLSSDEYRQIQAHVRIGVHILSDLKKLHHLLPGVAYHHESLDGSGYPSGLRGDAIPLPARILAVADSYDAMTSDRPYRRHLSPNQIDEAFRKGSGVQWDARVVQALFACREDLERIRQKGLGESLHKAINGTLGRA